jgi:hypothetical protein
MIYTVTSPIARNMDNSKFSFLIDACILVICVVILASKAPHCGQLWPFLTSIHTSVTTAFSAYFKSYIQIIFFGIFLYYEKLINLFTFINFQFIIAAASRCERCLY